MRTLRQLANDERPYYSSAAQVVEECFYMDDLLHGSDSVTSARKLQEDLKLLLKAGGFNLRKWRSNYQELHEKSEANCYDFKQAESHGFCDASTKSYAAVVYCKTMNREQTKISLLVGKSRLVPCNKSISLLRLELSGAQLLAKLIAKVKESLFSLNMKVYGWTDSTAVLGWLQGDANRWKIFVANRVLQIIQEIPADYWGYVKSTDNPADCASRGLTSSKLREHNLWWNGPIWLRNSKIVKPLNYLTNEEVLVNRQTFAATSDNATCHSIVDDMLAKHSSFTKIVRVVA